MSASRSGSRSAHRSARLRMFNVATVSRSMSGRFLGNRHREPERGAPALLRPDADATAVLLHGMAGDREAEAGATSLPSDASAIDFVEALEDPRLRLAGDADALVGHRRDDRAVLDLDA